MLLNHARSGEVPFGEAAKKKKVERGEEGVIISLLQS